MTNSNEFNSAVNALEANVQYMATVATGLQKRINELKLSGNNDGMQIDVIKTVLLSSISKLAQYTNMVQIPEEVKESKNTFGK